MTETRRNRPTVNSTYEISVSRGWPSLTTALKKSDTPLRQWLDERFPTKNTKAEFQRYKESVGPLLVPPSTTPFPGGTGTIGGAFDYLVRFLIDAQPDVHLPAIGARRYGGRMPTALSELASALGTVAPSPDQPLAANVVTVFDGPTAATVVSPDLIARGCWALCLLTELSRRSFPIENSPLGVLNPDTVTGNDLLTLASTAALDQLAALRTQAEQVLLPAAAARPGRWAIGPVFTGSALMNADADLILEGALIEIKTLTGRPRADGTHHAVLDNQTLFQILGYVLLDFHDEFTIREVALFNARYGHLTTWHVQDLLDTLAGHPVNLSALRAEFEQFLRAGATPISSRSNPAADVMPPVRRVRGEQ